VIGAGRRFRALAIVGAASALVFATIAIAAPSGRSPAPAALGPGSIPTREPAPAASVSPNNAPRTTASPAPARTDPPETTTTAPAGTITLPPFNGPFDYQLGGAYAPPADVTIVDRDRTASPAAGVYNICYVNGFQTQPGESAWWLANHPTLLLRDGAGTPLIDPDWPDEYILDISTAAKRAAIATIVGAWIDGCAAAGFDAVEIDNLDTFARFPTRLTADNAVALGRTYADEAHRVGLAIAQKNSAELVSRRTETTFDFAVVEECSFYDECATFTAGYPLGVLMVEYDRPAFLAACAAQAAYSVVLRDVKLRPVGATSYVREAC
jgi:Glycoside-hydrolase family GH114